MDQRVQVGRLAVAASLHRFIVEEALPGSGVDPDAFWAGAENQHALHQILEFTDVSRPRIISQPILGGDTEAAQRQMLFVHQPVDVVAQ